MMRLVWILVVLAVLNALSCPAIEAREVLAKEDKEKAGAGLMIVNDGDVLLLLRGLDTNNPRTWAFPGGNIDRFDDDPLDTALREAEEEMGQTPRRFAVVDTIQTERGKDDKRFTVFVVKITDEERAGFVPKLNVEHTDYRWYEYSKMKKIPNLHPVVDNLVDDHETELDNAMVLAQSLEVPFMENGSDVKSVALSVVWGALIGALMLVLV